MGVREVVSFRQAARNVLMRCRLERPRNKVALEVDVPWRFR